jgi:hypothetical protein
VADLPRLLEDGGRSATLSSAWRVGGSTTVVRWTETVADLPTGGRMRVEVPMSGRLRVEVRRRCLIAGRRHWWLAHRGTLGGVTAV